MNYKKLGLDTLKKCGYKGDVVLEAHHQSLDAPDEKREEILTANKEDIRNLAGIVESVMKDDYLCVVGSEGKIKENKDMFLEIKNLL